MFVGTLVRLDETKRVRVMQQLADLPGVTSFAVDDHARLGLVAEIETPEAAYRLLDDCLPGLEGVLSVDPVCAYFE